MDYLRIKIKKPIKCWTWQRGWSVKWFMRAALWTRNAIYLSETPNAIISGFERKGCEIEIAYSTAPHES